MVRSLWKGWNLRKPYGHGMYTEREGNVVASERPQPTRSNRLHKQHTRQIYKECNPGKEVWVRTEVAKELSLDARSNRKRDRTDHSALGKVDYAREKASHLGRRGRLGWKESTEKPIGRFLVGAKFPGMVRSQCNKPLQRIFR